MPDTTEQTLLETEPYYPSAIEDLLEYEHSTIYLRSHDLESYWTKNEINTNLLAWVKAGLLLDRVCRTRAYRDKFSSWQNFCERAIYKSKQMVRRTIKAAKIVMALAISGFSILPSCISQAERLKKYFDDDEAADNQNILCAKWQQVIDRVPINCINANSIDEELGHVKRNKKKISVDESINARLENIANSSDEITSKTQVINELLEEYENSRDPLFGLSETLKQKIRSIAAKKGVSEIAVMEELLGESLPSDDEIESQADCEFADDSETTPVPDRKIQRWEADLEDLVAQHDKSVLNFCFWLKLFPRSRGAISELTPLSTA